MLTLTRQRAAEVLYRHCGGAGNQIAEIVCKIGIDGAYKQLI